MLTGSSFSSRFAPSTATALRSQTLPAGVRQPSIKDTVDSICEQLQRIEEDPRHAQLTLAARAVHEALEAAVRALRKGPLGGPMRHAYTHSWDEESVLFNRLMSSPRRIHNALKLCEQAVNCLSAQLARTESVMNNAELASFETGIAQTLDLLNGARGHIPKQKNRTWEKIAWIVGLAALGAGLSAIGGALVVGLGAAALLTVMRLANAERMHRDTAWSKLSDALAQVSRFVHNCHDQKLTLNTVRETQQNMERTVLEVGLSNRRLALLVTNGRRGSEAHGALVDHDSETTYLRGVLNSPPDGMRPENAFSAVVAQGSSAPTSSTHRSTRMIAAPREPHAPVPPENHENEYCTHL